MLLPWSIFSADPNVVELAAAKQASRKKRRQLKRRSRPAVEKLEDRVTPTTFHVDVMNPNPGVGTLANPFNTLQAAVKAANLLNSPGADDIFVYGNTSLDPQKVYKWTRDGDVNGDGQVDGNLVIEANDTLTFTAQTLLQGPSGTPARVIVKLANNIIDVKGQLRIEGQSASNAVFFTSFQDDTIGGDTNVDGNISAPDRLNWGGIRYRSTAVSQGTGPSSGSFVNFANIRYSGQTLFDEVAGADTEFAAIRMEGTLNANLQVTSAVKVRVWNTTFQHGSKALDVHFGSLSGTGPDVGHTIPDPNAGTGVTGSGARISADPLSFVDNSINGLFVNIPFVPVVTPFSVTSEWDDISVPYVLSQRLIVTQTLTIDSGMIVKSQREQIDTTTVNSARLLVKGTANQPVLFTAITDDDPGSLLAPYYVNGSADTNNDDSQTIPRPGDWGGVQVNNGSIDHAVFLYGGGQVPFNGRFVNRAPLNILTFDLRPFAGPLENFQVSNSEITQTLGGVPAMEVLGQGIISVTDNFIHDNSGSIAIYAGSTVGTIANPDPLGGGYFGPIDDAGMNYLDIANPLGGYGVHYRRNIVENNGNNGVYAERIIADGYPTDTNIRDGYLDDTDIVQTIGTTLTVAGPNQVRQFMSQRTVFPSINTGYLDRFQGAGLPANSGNAQFAAFVSQLTSQGALQGPNPTNGDNTLFYNFINFQSTARGLTIPGVTANAPGDIRGEEWRDWGVNFLTSAADNLFPFKVMDVTPNQVSPNVLTTADSDSNDGITDDSSMEMVFPNLVTAVGFWIVNNGVTSPNERIEFYGDQNQLLERIALPTTTNGVPVFVGRISKAPIYRVAIFEDANDGDQMGLDDLYYVTAEQSLVVKMAGGSDITAGNIAMGTAFDGSRPFGSGSTAIQNSLQDVLSNGTLSVGPTLRILGQGNHPVRITSLADDGPGAGVFGHVQRDTDNSNNQPFGGSWVGIRLLPGVNSNRSEILNQLANGTLLRQSSDLNPYTLGDEPGSIPDRLTRLVNGLVPATQNVQDGTLIEHAEIRFAAIGIDNQGYPAGKLAIENNSVEGNSSNHLDDTTATAQVLQPLNETDSGAVRLGGHSFFPPPVFSNVPNFDVDFYQLTDVAPGSNLVDNPIGIAVNPNVGYLPIYVDIDHTRNPVGNGSADAADAGQFNVWGFNALNQLVYANSRDAVNPWGLVAPQNGTANYMGPMAEIQGDVPANFNSNPAGSDWDVEYIAITPRGVYPSVLINSLVTNSGVTGGLNVTGIGVFLLPLDPGNGGGFAVLFVDTNGVVQDTPAGSAFMVDPATTLGYAPSFIAPVDAAVKKNYEMEVRRPNFVTIQGNQVDVHQGRQNDAIRNLDGQIILRQNLIRDFVTAGVYLHDHWFNTATFNVPAVQDVVTQSGRYFMLPGPGIDINYLDPNPIPNAGLFANPNDYIPGVQVYNNVITNGGGHGVQITEHENLLQLTLPVPTGYHQVLSNTIHSDNGNGVDIVSKGGPNVLDNIITRVNTGVRITDLNFAGATTPSATTVVNYNLFYQDAATVSGQSNGQNNIANVDPQYVDVTNQDLRIFFNSPAVDSALSNLSDRLFTLREPDEPTWAPTDDYRNKARIDNPNKPNVGSGQFPFFDLGALEANESPLRVIALRPFFTSTVVAGPVATFEIDFAGRVAMSTIVLVDNPATPSIDERTVKVTQGLVVKSITSVTNTYDAARDIHTLRFTFDQPLADGTYKVFLDGTTTASSPGAIRDIAGQLLDGEFPSPATSPVFSFPSGNNVPAGDFNYTFTVVTSSIGDLVWNDLNGDGVKQGSEPVMANVQITLLGAGPDGVLDTLDDVTYVNQITNSNGIYTFNLLMPGLYRIDVLQSSLPANFVQTNPPVPPEKSPREIVLGLDEHRTDVDFGFWQDLRNGTIGNLVWNDVNGDGARQPSEPGIGGVRINLLGSGPDRTLGTPDDVFFPPRFTGADGAYAFQNLPAWTYLVTVDLASPALLGFSLTTGNSPLIISLLPSQSIGTADFGFQLTSAAIGGLVFEDLNQNGTQQAGEVGFNAAVVFIDANNNNVFDVGERFTTSDAQGNWTIGALASGTYKVMVNRSTLPGALPWIPTTTYPQIVTVDPGASVIGVIFGFIQDPGNALIGGRVFNDLLADGTFNGADTGLSGINVLLLWAGIDNVLGNADDLTFGPFVTSATGQYVTAANLPSGQYRVLVQNPPSPGWFITTAGGNPLSVTLAPSQVFTTADFGYQLRLGQIGDMVFNDFNGNGIFDPGVGNPEAGINGVRVNLLWAGPDGDFNTTGDNLAFPTKSTAGGGLFNFINLAVGNYQLTVDTSSPVLTGYAATTPNPLFLTLTAFNQVINNADFGFQLRTSSIGDSVFFDVDGDGFQAVDEFGIPDVRVYLDVANNGFFDVGVDPAVLTDTNGIYHFTNLAPGLYHVRVDESTLPPGSSATIPADLLQTVNLNQNQVFNDADFGILLPSTFTTGIFYFTLAPGGNLINTDSSVVSFTSSDIVKLVILPNGTVNYSVYFRGSDVGLSGGSEAIDAFTFLANGDIIMSLAGTGSVRQNYAAAGVGSGNTISAFGEDLLRFRPTQINGDTAGAWSMYLDGSTKGLSGSSENIDAVAVLSDGRIILSTKGNVSAGGVTGVAQDLLSYQPSKNKWAPYFKGSRVGVNTALENIDALFIPDTSLQVPTLIISTSGSFNVNGGVTGGKEDALRFDATELEKIPKSKSVTKGTFDNTLAFDGSAFGIGAFNVTGMFLTAAPGPNPLQASNGKTSDSLTERVGRWTEADGVVNVFVDASTFTTPQVDRIHSALANLNAAWQPASGMRLVEVANPALADVRIRGAATTAIGGQKQGVLGLTQVSYDVGISGWLADGAPVANLLDHAMGGQTSVTLVNSWNWFVGTNPAQIGKKQFDFQSVVTHELGHAIGLVENTADRQAVMFETLKPGQTRRTFDAIDVATIDELYGQLLDHGVTVKPDAGADTIPSTTDNLAMLMTSTGAKLAQPKTLASNSGRTTATSVVVPAKSLDDVAVDRLFALQAKAASRLNASGSSTTSLDQPWWNALEG